MSRKAVGASFFMASILSFSSAPQQVDSIQEPLRVESDVERPLKRKHVNPVYPEEARQLWVQGIVVLDAVITVEGKVARLTPLRSIPELDQAATDAVKQWEYEPKLLDGKAVPIVMTVAVNFTLPDADKWLVHPRGKAELKLEDYVVERVSEASKIYRGRVTNVSTKHLRGTRAILYFEHDRVSTGDGATLSPSSSQKLEPPRKVKNVRAMYPTIGAGGVLGLVVVEAVIDTEGNVQNLRVLRSIPLWTTRL